MIRPTFDAVLRDYPRKTERSPLLPDIGWATCWCAHEGQGRCNISVQQFGTEIAEKIDEKSYFPGRRGELVGMSEAAQSHQ